jgi:DNA primase
MEIKQLKNFLLQNPDKIKLILEELGCHHITKHDGMTSSDSYFTFGNPNGDNPRACTVYLSESLLTINYTRNICKAKETCDFIDLVNFYCNDKSFFENLKWISEFSGISYYHKFDDDIPQSLKIIKKIKEMLDEVENNDEEDVTPIIPKDIYILKNYYYPYANQIFQDDNISIGTQAEFQIAYDPASNRIVIPIFDELNNFVGVKGRWFYKDVPENESKYIFLEKCPRHKILYGYNLTQNYIKQKKEVYVFEAEKSVLQAWSYSYKNSVATMGKKISIEQIDKLSRLGVDICLAFDKDVKFNELQDIDDKFRYGVNVYALFDDNNILPDKYSPTDKKEIFEIMIKNNKIKLK